jgi:hypothetical protein
MAGRCEHIEFCKRRALAYVERGDLQQAFTSMASDLKSHPETENHPHIMFGMGLMMNGHLGTTIRMREFIEGFK